MLNRPSTLDPESCFPQNGVVAYLSLHGPIHARTLSTLNALRAWPDYESCMPLLTDQQLNTDWDFSLACHPRSPLSDPIRVPQAEIDVTWDPYKLRALIEGSRQDLGALHQRVVEVERDVHDVIRVIENSRRRERVVYPDSWLGSAGGRRGHRDRQATPTPPAASSEYKVDDAWDVYKLREVISSIQADVEKTVIKLAKLETELRDRQKEADGYPRS
ncbi:hypothetical protein EsH8_IX_000421 [Colletotrichum jinshuiense]